MRRRTKSTPLPKEGRIALHTTISPQEYAEVIMYQEIEYPSTMALVNKLLRFYIRDRRRHYGELGMLEGMLRKLK